MNKEYSLRDKKLIQVRTLIMGKINNNNNMYEIKWDSKGAKPKGRLYFVGTGEEKKLIHSIRAEYIHLSAPIALHGLYTLMRQRKIINESL